MRSSKEIFLSAARLGIGHPVETHPKVIDWDKLKALAERHGLSAIVLDGVIGNFACTFLGKLTSCQFFESNKYVKLISNSTYCEILHNERNP